MNTNIDMPLENSKSVLPLSCIQKQRRPPCQRQQTAEQGWYQANRLAGMNTAHIPSNELNLLTKEDIEHTAFEYGLFIGSKGGMNNGSP